MLKEKLGKKRILLSDNQRRRLAIKGKLLGRKMLEEVGTLFTPDTILRWHRQLVAQKGDHRDKRKSVGRPRIRQVIVNLILQLAKENPTWGFDRIQGALANVGYPISDTTVKNILKEHGIEPASNRQRTGSWSTFLKAHFLENLVLGAEILNGSLLFPVHSTGEYGDQEMPGVKDRNFHRWCLIEVAKFCVSRPKFSNASCCKLYYTRFSTSRTFFTPSGLYNTPVLEPEANFRTQET